MIKNKLWLSGIIGIAAILTSSVPKTCPADEILGAGKLKPSVQMVIKSMADKVVAGGTVVEVLTVKNIGSDHANFTVIDATVDTHLSVIGPEGKLLSITPAGKNYIYQFGYPNRRIFKNLAPGGEYSESMYPAALYDFSQPGLYKITASRDFYIGADRHIEHATSNTDIVEITAAPQVKTDNTK